MFLVLGIMACGILAGRLLRRFEPFQRLGGPILWTVMVLLFLMGVAVGGDAELLSSLPTLGWQAALIAAASTAGSVALGALVWRLWLRKPSDTSRRAG